MSFIESRSALRRPQLLIGASLAALMYSNAALAQDASSPPPPPADEVVPPTDDQAEANIADQLPPEEAPAATATGDTIVVTGSRIRQTEFTSPDPVTSIDPETAERQGKIDTAEMLQSSPIAAGSTQITSAISSNFVTNGGPGAQTIDLRGLGANRTLVLLNGRRAGPAGTRGGVSSFDLNVLPQSIVQRVEILKTGASSIYGSDAVAGVVNLITKTEMDGFQIDANGSVPTRSGGEQFRISGMWGKRFDRGHVLVALDYFKNNELARGDRDYLGCPEAFVFRPNSNERADLIDPRTGQFRCEDLRWGHVWTYDLERIFGIGPGNLFVPDGTYVGPVNLIQFQYPGETLGIPPIDPTAGLVAPLIAPPGWFPTGYSPASLAVQNGYHPFVLEATLVPKTERYSIYADASYELTENIEAFAEFLGNRRETYQNGWRQFWSFGYTGDLYGDPTDPYGTFWANGWSGFNWLSPTGITNQSDNSQRVDYWRGVGGFRGDFGGLLSGWSFDAHVQYSHNKGKYRSQQLLQDVYDVAYFQTASCVGTTLPFSGKQCIDLPWLDPFFLAGQMTPEQLAFMFDWEEGRTIYKQLSGEASMTGNLFHLPAGPVGMAIGITARRDQIHDRPGEITFSPNPFFDPSIPLTSRLCTSTFLARINNYPCQEFHNNAWGSTGSTITAGHSNTTEAFGEIHIPVLRDRPFFNDLTLSGAARITNVKSIQKDTGVSDKDTGNWTYKLGANWAVTNWLRFRGTYGTSFRAPALFEQFKGNETSFVSNRGIDPCVNWGQNLANGVISQRIADNCAADGIPPDYIGGSISATVLSEGGIGVLDPETSTAKTASIILTPTFRFLPETRLSLAVDYFDIEVRGEISQLGPGTIVFGCYSSDFFPDDPLCDLFTRGIAVDEFAINTVRDKYINIASQRNEGIDVTGLIQQRIGRWGSLSFLAQMTWQLTDTFALFADTEEDRNGLIGDPKWVGDFNLTWNAPDGWSLFWGMDVYGKASSFQRVVDRNPPPAGLPAGCLRNRTRGEFCIKMDVPATFYHNASITKALPALGLEATFGVANLFDTTPPRVTAIAAGGTLSGTPPLIGPVVGTSQYDFIGRRFFLNISKKF